MVSPGSIVRYILRPDWGHGLVRWEYPNGLLMVAFDDVPYQGEFSAGELEEVIPAETRA